MTERAHEFDIYIHKKDKSLRMATAPGAGLPRHVDPRAWRLMRKEEVRHITDDAEEDINERGFCYYKLVE